jgi:hypothetical protein
MSFSAVQILRLVVPGAVLAAMVLLGAGCTTPALNDPARVGPFYQPTNVASDPTLGGIRRVVLLPVWHGDLASEETAQDLDPVFRQALQDQNRFEIVSFSREDLRRRFGQSSLSSAAPLPHDFIATVQRLFAADAVMFVDLTTFRPYHPLAIGVRSRLAAVGNLRLVWSFDNVFSADDPTVAAGARHYFLHSEHQGVPGDLTPAVLQSPLRFAAYVANATFVTLPPVTLAALTQTSRGSR